MIKDLLRAGADKVSLNSAAVRRNLINRNPFGNQCIVVAIDAGGGKIHLILVGMFMYGVDGKILA
jgi:imidazole glycerol phosphate synthase subunit HisF